MNQYYSSVNDIVKKNCLTMDIIQYVFIICMRLYKLICIDFLYLIIIKSRAFIHNNLIFIMNNNFLIEVVLH